ncbi:hypothetical protein TIFTF001_033430 [Ficus carica]|uniref:Uncharacterized protein n=1 Tax=Ficus carica TaxID=3494 RepID=A0AA88E596_FICCA|nr:hypothetical protein TIFTF001_033430 [Ficus carica]
MELKYYPKTLTSTEADSADGFAWYDKKPEFMFKDWHAFVVEEKLKVDERIFLMFEQFVLFVGFDGGQINQGRK